jgi:hypothetical protein
MAFDLIQAGVATTVAKNGTITFAYPSGRDQDSYVGGNEVLVIPTHQSVLTVGAGSSPSRTGPPTSRSRIWGS